MKELIDITKLDNWLLNNPKYSQEDREIIIEGIEDYILKEGKIIYDSKAQEFCKVYLINGKRYLTPYIAICTWCNKTFKTEEKAFSHMNKEHGIYFCKEI